MTETTQQPQIDLKPHDWDEIQRILRTCVPEYEVWAFGSRVKGTARTYSDLDLAIISDLPLPLASMAELRQALDASDLTIKVDVVDWAQTSPRFRKIIEEKKLVVQGGAKGAQE
jgi:type I restriction enzyme S subunit